MKGEHCKLGASTFGLTAGMLGTFGISHGHLIVDGLLITVCLLLTLLHLAVTAAAHTLVLISSSKLCPGSLLQGMLFEQQQASQSIQQWRHTHPWGQQRQQDIQCTGNSWLFQLASKVLRVIWGTN